jgi:hypothetical protein
MSPDAGLHAGSRWTLLEQGRFVVGRCDDCGFATPARRARASAESDLLAHADLCEAPLVVDLAGVGLEEGGGVAGKGVASGRERLSAQGRS